LNHASAAPQNGVDRWHFSLLGWVLLGFALFTSFLPFYPVLNNLFDVWNMQPEYSHGILIPLISLFLIWRQRELLSRIPFHGSWAGLWLILLGLGMWYLAEISTIYVIGQYAFLAVLYGLVLTLVGPRVFRQLAVPLLILIFAIPLPQFFAQSLSLRLQLLSSAIGVGVIRLFGISVFLDGNVIDLGIYKLQVVEACSGLRYLYPLMTLAFIVSYFYRAPFWKRAVVFLASIPIAILMNSLRIGLIGVSVEYWGIRMAEGVLHDFEGWVVFMLSTIVLLILAVLLARVGGSKQRLRDILILDSGPRPLRSSAQHRRPMPRSFLVATALTTALALVGFTTPERVEIKPSRASFFDFPLKLSAWEGQHLPMEQQYLDQLRMDDYLFVAFNRAYDPPVNLWIAYYDSQRKGQSVHSPKSCLPGGGWDFATFGPHTFQTASGPMTVNRALITHGADRQLMYYWFQQRGRVVTNEYLVKWYIFEDAITRNRTDGALVRVIVPIPEHGSASRAEQTATGFLQTLVPQLPRYVPD
jgi:exosortase D (VPLPA-CTERM-specific)